MCSRSVDAAEATGLSQVENISLWKEEQRTAVKPFLFFIPDWLWQDFSLTLWPIRDSYG